MKTRNAITKLIAITMAVAVMVVTDSSRGNSNVVNTFLYSVPTFGYVPGQTARFSVAYPSTTEERTASVRAQVTLYDAQGNEVAHSREEEVPARQFRIFDFNRENLPLAGEPYTGRVQVRAVIKVVSMDGSEQPVKLSVSREVMDNRDGVSRDLWSSSLGGVDVHY